MPARGGAGSPNGSGCALAGYARGGDGGAGAVIAQPAHVGSGGLNVSGCLGGTVYGANGGGGGGYGRVRINIESSCECSGSVSPAATYGTITKK